jgi:hypothetical protein
MESQEKKEAKCREEGIRFKGKNTGQKKKRDLTNKVKTI